MTLQNGEIDLLIAGDQRLFDKHPSLVSFYGQNLPLGKWWLMVTMSTKLLHHRVYVAMSILKRWAESSASNVSDRRTCMQSDSATPTKRVRS